jgi:hypothetical protein
MLFSFTPRGTLNAPGEKLRIALHAGRDRVLTAACARGAGHGDHGDADLSRLRPS